MSHPTVAQERRSGIRWTVAGALALLTAFGFWWLVASTNTEGEHDAELLPLLALIPLAIGVYHLARSHWRAVR
jgi:hypothetical protein